MNTDVAALAKQPQSQTVLVALTVVLIVLSFPFDAIISRMLTSLPLGPDFRLELRTLQQYGQLSTTVVGLVVIWLVDPARRRQLLDWGVAIGVTSLACFVLKICAGRPRPKFGDPTTFVGLWRAYPFPSHEQGIALRYSWDLTSRHSWDLWSMPSSHTAVAAVMSVFLYVLYPRLRPFCIAMVIIVGCGRVLFHEHYLTDVLVGAVVGYVLARRVIGEHWGMRASDWIRRTLAGDKAPATSIVDVVD